MKYFVKKSRSTKTYYKIYDAIPDDVPEAFKVDSMGCYETCEINIGLGKHDLVTCKINEKTMGTKDFINMIPYLFEEITEDEYNKAKEHCQQSISFVNDIFEKL